MKTQRFTVNGSSALEQHLGQCCRRVLDGVLEVVPRPHLEALLLGGGYGRGEGGVLHTNLRDEPYNDLEFYVFIRGWSRWNTRKFGPALRHLAHELSPDIGAELEFKILSLLKLRRSPINMFYYDLVMGHRWLFGGEPMLRGCEHHRLAETMPLSEATRLLMNRCSGLLFACEKLQKAQLTPEDADFVGRNHAKAKLAFGDALLAAQGQYHWSVRTRHERLLHMKNHWPWFEQVQALHHQGVQFKLHPQRTSLDLPALKAEQTRLTELALALWLWLENRRLARNFIRSADYATDPVNKCPETNFLRNSLLNLAILPRLIPVETRVLPRFVVGNLRAPAALFRYPRQRVFNALSLLLWEPQLLTSAPLLRFVQRELNTSAVNFPELVSAYCNLWSRFN